MKILFVCDGNKCRSPMAEALLRQTLSEKGIDRVEVSSAGLDISPWSVAHSELRRVLGPSYSLVENRPSQPLTEARANESDLILGMEDRHVKQILERFPMAKGRVETITSYAGRKGDVTDYGDGEYGDVASWLRHCYNIILPCVETIAERLAVEKGRDSASSSMEKVD